MAQQPNVEMTEATRPRSTLEPGAANKWRTSKPGIPVGPDDVPSGGSFGSAGPDPGWGVKLVSRHDLPDDNPNLGAVITGLVQARAAALGRGAVPEDIEAALILCGYSEDPNIAVVERRERWLQAAPHDRRPGATAVSEVDRDLIRAKPEQIRYALRLVEET